MGAFVDSLFNILMSWVRALVSAIWALFNTERTTVLGFLGKNWIAIAAVIVIAGLVLDWMIWLIRWQPYHIWAKRVRRLLRIADPEDEADYSEADDMPPEALVYTQEELEQEEPEQDDEEAWLPLLKPDMDETQVQRVMETAENAPDEYQYPGMRYDDANAGQPAGDLGGTRRYAAVHAEGPGAAEVMRRRAEIDAWQLQMQEEARQKAEAERAARLAEAERERKAAQEDYEAERARLAQEAYEAEQARFAQEAYEAEQARLAQEAYEAEQARLAQEEYERQLAEYERQRAQYERDLAEYERQKAEYEAALARQALEEEAKRQEEARIAEAAARQAEAQTMEIAEEIVPAARRRRRSAAYSDYVEGEAVTELPEAPQWKPMQQMEKPAQESKPEAKTEKKSIWRSGVEKMAQMMEAEENDVTGIASLPPRVDKNKAYKPAKKPKR